LNATNAAFSVTNALLNATNAAFNATNAAFSATKCEVDPRIDSFFPLNVANSPVKAVHETVNGMPVVRTSAVVPGVVYTPRAVCEPIVRRALVPLIEGKSEREILSLRVCDPAIGEGAFAIEIVRVLAEALGGGPRARLTVAERCVLGADIDARAVTVTRHALEDFVGARVPALREQIRVGDALALTWPPLDAMVGNPPYIRQELLGERKTALRRFEVYDGVADLYVYFLELAHRVVRPGGRYAWVVPNKFLTAAYAMKLRALLAREGSVDGLVDLARAPLFRDADAFSCIVWGTVGRPTRARPAIEARRVTSTITVANALAEPGIAHPRERWQATPWHIEASSETALLDRLARRWPRFDEVVPLPSRGIVTGCNRAFVIDDAMRARLLAAEPAAASLIRPLMRGRDVRAWRAADSARHVLLVDRGVSLDRLPRVLDHLARFRSALEPRPREHHGGWPGRKPGTYRWYELQDPVGPLARARTPRLFYQDIQTTAACCLDTTGTVVPDTTVWVVDSDDRFLLAVLNSPLYGWYARRRFPPALNGAVRPKLDYMRALPIARPTSELRDRIAELVNAQLTERSAVRERELAGLVLDAYELTRAQRALIAAG
jgi:methylase of polypeptide subunit release factors